MGMSSTGHVWYGSPLVEADEIASLLKLDEKNCYYDIEVELSKLGYDTIVILSYDILYVAVGANYQSAYDTNARLLNVTAPSYDVIEKLHRDAKALGIEGEIGWRFVGSYS